MKGLPKLSRRDVRASRNFSAMDLRDLNRKSRSINADDLPGKKYVIHTSFTRSFTYFCIRHLHLHHYHIIYIFQKEMLLNEAWKQKAQEEIDQLKKENQILAESNASMNMQVCTSFNLFIFSPIHSLLSSFFISFNKKNKGNRQ